ncbi:MAG: AAA family ATPase [Myxococcales bacterium]|nr:AAA family ATPase [Myxococcales bacterium]
MSARERGLGPVVELRETHISRVYLRERDVIKIKKPVYLGFLDFRTLAAREQACAAEVELGRRLAPDVYLGLVPITRDPDGGRRLDGDGPVIDWAVRMRRLPDAWRADVRLAEGRLEANDLRRVAEVIAAFHASARIGDAYHGEVAILLQNVRENFDQAGEHARALLTAERAAAIEARQLEFLAERGELLRARAAAGRVRDGHGDLRLEHVYLDDDGGIRVIDCIEFNERFRIADVCADVAFLSMELAASARVDLAEVFLAAYAEASGDFDLYPLVDFFEGYRAYVRGKVACMTAAGDVSWDIKERARAEATRLFTLAYAAQRGPLVTPRLVAIGGPIASGKSTIARHLGERMGAPVLSSDLTRKQLVGVDPTTPVHDEAWSGIYTLDATERVYRELLRRAAVVLRSGRPVIVDASFRTRALRGRVRALAAELGAPLRVLECRAPRHVLEARLRARAEQGGVSDGRLEILDDFLARWEEIDELAAEEHLTLDTSRPLAETLKALAAALPTWPQRPVP